jgi:centromere-localized protein 2
MAPTESEILANYLIQPSSLTSITTLDQFRALFPRPLQSSPQVRSLYRDLQAQRNAVLDGVAENVGDEVKRGNVMRKEAIRARREAEREHGDPEVEMERAVRKPPPYLFGRCLGETNSGPVLVVWRNVWCEKRKA